MIYDVKQNNHILPLHTDEERFVTELGVLAGATYEKAPIFNQLQSRFWTERFNELNTLELKQMCLALGLIRRKETKQVMIHLLVSHYQEKVN